MNERVNPILAWGRVRLGIPRTQAPWYETNRRQFEELVALGQFPHPDLVTTALAASYQKAPTIYPAPNTPNPVRLPENFAGFGEEQLKQSLLKTAGFRVRDSADPIRILACEVPVPSGDFDLPTDPSENGPCRSFRADFLLGIGADPVRIVHAELKPGSTEERATQATYQALMYWSQLAGHWKAYIEQTFAQHLGVTTSFAADETWIIAPSPYFHRRWGRDGEPQHYRAALRAIEGWNQPSVRFFSIAPARTTAEPIAILHPSKPA